MISPSVICSKASLATIILLLLSSPALCATVTGKIELTNSNSSLVKKQKNYSGVVVWLRPLDNAPIYPAKKHVQMLQRNKKFWPHILAITVGTTVDFPNEDLIFHNAFSNFDGEIFDIGLYPPGSSRAVRFERTGTVHIFCNIHPSMSAIIVVLDSPYFTQTDLTGRFSITHVPPGSYELHFFHERATPETLEKLTHIISVSEASDDLSPVTISETGYLPVAHKNKYGRDYPAQIHERPAYALPLK
jgi:plastocyanin